MLQSEHLNSLSDSTSERANDAPSYPTTVDKERVTVRVDDIKKFRRHVDKCGLISGSGSKKRSLTHGPAASYELCNSCAYL